ncbi:NUDIX domain-containing protein [Glutamicibacter endophyticus]
MTVASPIDIVYVALIRDLTVLLQRRHNTGFMDGYFSCAAAGHVEPAESPISAACREATEELGILIVPSDLLPLAVRDRRQDPAAPAPSHRDHFSFAVRGAVLPVSRSRKDAPNFAGFPSTTCHLPSCHMKRPFWQD